MRLPPLPSIRLRLGPGLVSSRIPPRSLRLDLLDLLAQRYPLALQPLVLSALIFPAGAVVSARALPQPLQPRGQLLQLRVAEALEARLANSVANLSLRESP